jgi:hypothetical protein
MFWSYQLMRGLSAQTPTQQQQREADERLGCMAAAISRSVGEVYGFVRTAASVVGNGGRVDTSFRKNSRRYARPRSNQAPS